MSYELKELMEEFERITSKFDLVDWQAVRNDDYWESDKIVYPIEKLRYKLVRIRYYDKYGVPITI